MAWFMLGRTTGGLGAGKGSFQGPGMKMLRPDLNLKLFEPVATLSGAEAQSQRRGSAVVEGLRGAKILRQASCAPGASRSMKIASCS
jgi:hypothetical protein